MPVPSRSESLPALQRCCSPHSFLQHPTGTRRPSTHHPWPGFRSCRTPSTRSSSAKTGTPRWYRCLLNLVRDAGGKVLASNARRKPVANRLLVEQQTFHARDLLRLIPRAQDLIDVMCDGSDAIQCGGRLRNESHGGSCPARAGIAAPAQPTTMPGITTGETLNRVRRCNATNTDF